MKREFRIGKHLPLKKQFYINCFWAAVFSLLLAPVANGQYVHTNGTQIVGPNGNQIHLHGINLGNWLLWEGYLMMGDFNYRTHTQFFDGVKSAFGGNLDQAIEFEHQWRLNYVTDYSISELSGLGYNFVRVPFHFNMFWDYNSGAPRDHGFQYIDNVVNYCRNHNMYVLLDMHAAPGYQNPGDHSDNGNSNSSQPRGSVTFWDGNNVNIAAQVWQHIAAHYANEPVIWGYDLINEPVPQDGREYELLPSLITLRNAIRQVDNNHIIVAEGSWWGSDMQKLDWTDGSVQSNTGVYSQWDNNLVYSTHHYSSDVSPMNDRVAMTNRLNIPLYLGEYGESDDGTLRTFTDWCQNNNVHYSPWSFKKMYHDKCLWSIQPSSAYNAVRDFIANGGTPPSNAYNDMIWFCQNNIANGSSGINWYQGFYDATKYTGSIPDDGGDTGTDLCNGSYTAVPATLQAEDYCDMLGIETESTSDDGGGSNVGWIDADDYMAYSINVPSAGTYTVSYRVASANGGGSIRLEGYGGGTNYGEITVPSTGGWQTWTTISHDITLSAGDQAIAIVALAGGWNINWISIASSGGNDTGTSWSSLLQAEDFTEMSGVQTETTSDDGGGSNVGWIDAGDWMGYAIDIPSSGTYTVEYRVASPNTGGSLKLEALGGGTEFGSISIQQTGGWQTWTTISHNVSLSAGQQNIAIAVTSGGWNLNWIQITSGLKSAITMEEAKLSNKSEVLAVYPNPATNQVSILGLADATNIEVYNISGSKVSGNFGTSIDVSDLASGIYVLRIYREGTINQFKFMKQ